MRYCTKCWVPETRPRITFNEEGVCSACQWSEEKKQINWQERSDYLARLCDTYRKPGNDPDVVVPYSGGKDSIYVAYKMRDEYGMTPLLMTVLPHLETDIGEWNRRNMCPHMERYEINLSEEKYRSLARRYFIKQGRPKHPWECAISATVISQAVKIGIPFIMYGEEGEAEYGGTTRELDRWKQPVDLEYLTKYYWQEGQCDWKYPEDLSNVFFTQYSRYENWSPSEHANFAICKGMRTLPVRSIGTYTAHSQLSDDLQDLHAYLMFLKFGFGRATSDACIAIREGWADRGGNALEWIEVYDGECPTKLVPKYLEYFDMDEQEFMDTVNKFGNDEILARTYKYIWTTRAWLAKERRRGTPLEYTNPNRYDY